jgi:molybdopterin synthase catalytic subunit
MILLTSEPIDLTAATAHLQAAEVGGIVTFAGTVRNHSHGRQVLWLEYEAYAEMARTQLAAIGAAMQERWPLLHLALIHRTGRLEIGDAAVFVGAASAHRADAFAACRFGIDAIKDDVPIWKREVFVGGQVWVDDCCSSGRHDRLAGIVRHA